MQQPDQTNLDIDFTRLEKAFEGQDPGFGPDLDFFRIKVSAAFVQLDQGRKWVVAFCSEGGFHATALLEELQHQGIDCRNENDERLIQKGGGIIQYHRGEVMIMGRSQDLGFMPEQIVPTIEKQVAAKMAQLKDNNTGEGS